MNRNFFRYRYNVTAPQRPPPILKSIEIVTDMVKTWNQFQSICVLLLRKNINCIVAAMSIWKLMWAINKCFVISDFIEWCEMFFLLSINIPVVKQLTENKWIWKFQVNQKKKLCRLFHQRKKMASNDNNFILAATTHIATAFEFIHMVSLRHFNSIIPAIPAVFMTWPFDVNGK